MPKATKFPSGSVKTVVEYPTALRDRVDAALSRVTKRGWKGEEKPWTVSELIREGMRRVVLEIEEGRFVPLAELLREGEAEIVAVDGRPVVEG